MKKIALWLVLLSLLLALPVSAANVTTVAAIPQSTTAAINYLKDAYGTSGNTYLVPGLMQTVTRTSDMSTVTTCDSMTPQGICFAGPGGCYLLISAYCNCGEKHMSVIYVIDTDTKEYKVTLILDTNCHVGGLAYDGYNYIWVCDSQSSGKRLRSFRYTALEDAVQDHNYWTVYTQSTMQVDCTPSYMCCADDYLYVGTFDEENSDAVMYFYSVDGKNISKAGSFTVKGLVNIQGMSIRKGCMLLTCSYGRTKDSTGYLFTDPVSRFVRDGAVYNASSAKTLKLPNMAEGCYIGGSYTTFLFESGAKTYRSSLNTRPLDKYVRLKHEVTGITLMEGTDPRMTSVNGVYRLLASGNTGFAIESNGSTVKLQNRAEVKEQKFDLVPLGNNRVAIEIGGKCLATSGDSVVLAAGNGSSNQKWLMMDNFDGTYYFVNDANGKFLDISNGTLSAGTAIQTWNGNGTPAQKWKLEAPGSCNHSLTTTQRQEATCTADGFVKTICRGCDYVRTETIPALGHSYDSGRVTTAPSCGKTGVRTFTCQRCSATRTESIAALSHSYLLISTTPANCTTDGKNVYSCANCSAIKNETIPALGHSFQNGTCVRCGADDGSKPADLVFAATTIGLEDKIIYTAMTSKANDANYDRVYVEFTNLDACDDRMSNHGTDNGTYYNARYTMYQFPIYVCQMTDRIAATVYGVRGGKTYEGQTVVQTVEQFVLAILGSMDSAKQDMCANLLEYGAMMQNYFSYRLEHLANDELGSYAGRVIHAAPVAENTFSTTNRGLDEVTLYTRALSIGSVVQIQYVFKLNGLTAEDVYVEITLDGKTTRYEGDDLVAAGKYTAVVFEGLLPTQADDTISVTVYDNFTHLPVSETISDTLTSAVSVYQSASVVSLRNAVNAMLNYYRLAAIAFGK